MDERKKFNTVCCNIGLNVSIVVNILARKMIQEKSITFCYLNRIDPFYSMPGVKALQKSI